MATTALKAPGMVPRVLDRMVETSASPLAQVGAVMPKKLSNNEFFVDELNRVGEKVFGGDGSGYLKYKLGKNSVENKPLSQFYKENVLDYFDQDPYNVIEDLETPFSELPKNELRSLLKKAISEERAFGDQLGVQGLAHGVDLNSGEFIGLDSVSELIGKKKAFIGAHTDDPEFSFYNLSDDSSSVDDLVEKILGYYEN
jgi:hypothetical protein